MFDTKVDTRVFVTSGDKYDEFMKELNRDEKMIIECPAPDAVGIEFIAKYGDRDENGKEEDKYMAYIIESYNLYTYYLEDIDVHICTKYDNEFDIKRAVEKLYKNKSYKVEL